MYFFKIYIFTYIDEDNLSDFSCIMKTIWKVYICVFGALLHRSSMFRHVCVCHIACIYLIREHNVRRESKCLNKMDGWVFAHS